MRVESLHIHPLKSCAALDVDCMEIGRQGPAGDRRWLLVDESARFITARSEARLVLLRAIPGRTGLRVLRPDGEAIDIGIPDGDTRLRVRIWNDEVDAAVAAADAHAWFSAYLDRPVRLVYMDDAARRIVDRNYGSAGDEVSFADGYPLLVISRAALEALNSRLASPVPMVRFRPNIVAEVCEPHAEDGWRRVRIGGIEFDAVKRCARCVFTTIDTGTGTRDAAGEPLATLRSYRRGPDGSGVEFGMNLIPRGTGTLRRHDPIEVLEAEAGSRRAT